MSKRKRNRNPPATIIITAMQQFEMEKPRYNPYQTGHGAHGNGKAYNRKQKHKGEW